MLAVSSYKRCRNFNITIPEAAVMMCFLVTEGADVHIRMPVVCLFVKALAV